MQSVNDAEANPSLNPPLSSSSAKNIEPFSLKHRSLRLKGAPIPTIRQITKHEFTRYAREHWPNSIPFPPGALQVSPSEVATKAQSSLQTASLADTTKSFLSQPIAQEREKEASNESSTQLSAQNEAPLEIFSYAVENLPEYRGFDGSLVTKLYQDLKASDFELPKIMILEFSQYFENYLWPFFHSGAATFEHLMSIILVINEKNRQNIPIWDCFLCHTTGNSASSPTLPTTVSISTEDLSLVINSELASHASMATNGIAPPNSSQSPSDVKANKSATSSLLLHYVPVNEGFLEQKFQRFFYRVLLLHMDYYLSAKEQSFIIKFLIKCFQSLEQEMVRKVCLSVCGPAMWFHLAEPFRDGFISCNVSAERLWKRTAKRYKKLFVSFKELELTTLSVHASAGEEDSKTFSPPETKDIKKSPCFIMNDWTLAFVDKNYFKSILDDFLYKIEDESATKDVTVEDLLYVERFVEFLIDLLSQLPTRRMLRPLLVGKQIVVRCKLSQIAQHVEGSLFRQLVDILSFYEIFEINDETGLPLSHLEYTDLHYCKVKEFQRMCFKHFKEDSTLLKVALLNISAIDSSASLLTLLDSLSLPTLFSLCEQLKLMDATEIIGKKEKDTLFGIKTEKSNLPYQKKSKKWVTAFLKAILLHYLEKKIFSSCGVFTEILHVDNC
ncbi:hypothetical protein IE077_001584, partial [Cardiosporidium cionae]